MYSILILAALGLVALVLRNFITSQRQKRLAREAGCQEPYRRPHRLPFAIDYLQQIMAADKDCTLPNFFVSLHEEQAPYKTWKQHLLGSSGIITTEPENVKAILATQFNDFELGPQRKGCFAPLFANGIFSDDGVRWSHSRALVRPAFTRDQITDLDALERHVQNLLRAITTNVNGAGWTGSKDLSPLLFRLTLDSSTEFLFGQSVESQLASLQDNNSPKSDDLEWGSFSSSWDTATMEVAKRFRLNSMYYMHNTKKMRDSIKEVHRFAEHFVKKALMAKEKDVEHGQKKQYVFLDELAKSTQDPVELRDQLLNVLVAGRDTTAGVLGWIFYHMAQQPELYARLRRDIINDFGTYDSPQNMDFTGLKNCTYLQWVLSEALRLHPSVPFNSRRATKDTTIPTGGGPDQKSPIFIPKGMEVNYMVHVMQRRKDLWGETAHEFKPERWLNRKAGWEFLPFNGGPRICLGQQFALTTAGYTVARICQRFDKLADLVPHDADPQKERYWFTVTGAPLHVKVRLHEASND